MDWQLIGDGDEAFVYKGTTDTLDGIGGLVQYPSHLVVCKREKLGGHAFNYQGHDLFCKNLVLKLLDISFLRSGQYSYPHIPLPLGSYNNSEHCGHYYSYAVGKEGFSWDLDVPEWNKFVNMFNTYGFRVQYDVADDLNGLGKNVIMDGSDNVSDHPNTWSRIDIGFRSLPFDYDKFTSRTNKGIPNLTEEETRLAILAAEYSNSLTHPIPKLDELEERVLDFRRNALSYLDS